MNAISAGFKTHTLSQSMPQCQTDLVTKAQLGLQAPENQVFEPSEVSRKAVSPWGSDERS